MKRKARTRRVKARDARASHRYHRNGNSSRRSFTFEIETKLARKVVLTTEKKRAKLKGPLWGLFFMMGSLRQMKSRMEK